jgi:hypothetical protein
MFITQETTEGLLAGRISERNFFCVTAQDYVVKRAAVCEGQIPSVLFMIHLLRLFCKNNIASCGNSLKISINVGIV